MNEDKLEAIYLLVVATLSCAVWLVAYEILFADLPLDWRHGLSAIAMLTVWVGVRFQLRAIWRKKP